MNWFVSRVLLFALLALTNGDDDPFDPAGEPRHLARHAKDLLVASRGNDARPIIARLGEISSSDHAAALSARGLRLWLSNDQATNDVDDDEALALEQTLADLPPPPFEVSYSVGNWLKNHPHPDPTFPSRAAVALSHAIRAATTEREELIAREARGHLFTLDRRYQEARHDLSEATRLAHQLKDPFGEARLLRRASFNEYQAGDFAQALALLKAQAQPLQELPLDRQSSLDAWRSHHFMTALCALELGQVTVAANAIRHDFEWSEELLLSLSRKDIRETYRNSSNRALLALSLLLRIYRDDASSRDAAFTLARALVELERSKLLRITLTNGATRFPVPVHSEELPPLPLGVAELRWFTLDDEDGFLHYGLLARFGDDQLFQRLGRIDAVDVQIARFTDDWLTPAGLARPAHEYEVAAETMFAAIAGDAIEWFRGDSPPARVILLPDRKLDDLPFDALVAQSRRAMTYRDVDYLLRRTEFVSTPSITILNRLPVPNQYAPALGLVDPLLLTSNGTPRPSLRFAERERQAIEQAHPRSRFLTGAQATLSNLIRSCEQDEPIGWLHLACHAVPDELLENRAALLVASNSTGGARLNAENAFPIELPLGCRVILSACATSSGIQAPGEGSLALWRAFLVAGASCVVSTLRDVDDRSAATWMANLHRNAALQTPVATSVRLASLDWIEGGARPIYPRGSSVQDACHPYLWAAFRCHGNDGGANPLPYRAITTPSERPANERR